jgi:hypothetical protein
MSPNGVARLLRVLASCRFESVLYLPRLIDGCSYYPLTTLSLGSSSFLSS